MQLAASIRKAVTAVAGVVSGQPKFPGPEVMAEWLGKSRFSPAQITTVRMAVPNLDVTILANANQTSFEVAARQAAALLYSGQKPVAFIYDEFVFVAKKGDTAESLKTSFEKIYRAREALPANVRQWLDVPASTSDYGYETTIDLATQAQFVATKLKTAAAIEKLRQNDAGTLALVAEGLGNNSGGSSSLICFLANMFLKAPK